jgi:PKD repeat protein
MGGTALARTRAVSPRAQRNCQFRPRRRDMGYEVARGIANLCALVVLVHPNHSSRGSMHRLSIAVAAAIFAAGASAQTITIPNGFAGVEGNSSTAYPWSRTTAVIHVQYCYDSTHFTNQGVTFPILVNRLKWRANSTATASTGGTYSNVVVDMSTSPLDQAAQTNTFASNHGPDRANVFTGSIAVAATPSIPTTTPLTPNIFYVDFAVTPFVYDPTLGDLVIDVLFPAGSWVGGTATPLDCQTTGALVSRMYNLTSDTALTGTIQQNVGPVVEVDYNPAAGLYANFTANVTGGATPLNVQFTDTSFSSAPGGVNAWAWDFDGDAIVDSNLQNPSFVYNNCGSYTVSLTVNDGVNPPSTHTKTNYIDTDIVTPSFTVAPVGPGTFQFTDTSTPAPTSWSWDFNGDAIPDSTAQNPVWVFTSTCGVQTITLSVSRLCKGPFSTTQTVVLSPNSFTTLLSGGNGLSAVGSGNTFDIQVTNPSGVTICAIEVAPYMATPVIGTPLTCTVWVTDAPGGYLANHTNAAVWRQVATGTGTFAGGTFTAPIPVMMALSSPIYVPLGTFGMAVHMTGGSGVAYTTLTAATTYPGPDFSITAGNGKGAPFSATANALRAWNGRIHYSTPTSGGLAGYGFFGAGCAGTLGIPHVLNTTQPTIGGTLSTNLDNLTLDIAVMVLGLSNTLSGGVIPLPFDIGVLGAPGCSLRVSLDVTATVIGAGTTATWSFNIPNVPTVLGFQCYNQAASLDTINAFGFVMSDAYAWVVGN